MCLLVWMAAAATTAQGQSPPNILFILTDDHRWDAMSCYGNPVLRTPSFDRLAAEGARLDAYYVASPLCSPSRAALLSGLYPHQRGNGVVDNHRPSDLPRGAPTVATRLKALGYVRDLRQGALGGDQGGGHQRCPGWLPKVQREREPGLMFNGRARGRRRRSRAFARKHPLR